MNDAIKYLEQLLGDERTYNSETAADIAAIVTAVALAKLSQTVVEHPDGPFLNIAPRAWMIAPLPPGFETGRKP